MLFSYIGNTKYSMKKNKEIKTFNKIYAPDRYAPGDFVVLLNQPENLFIDNRIVIAYNQKLLLMLHQLLYVLPEQRKRRISYDYIRLLE